MDIADLTYALLFDNVFWNRQNKTFKALRRDMFRKICHQVIAVTRQHFDDVNLHQDAIQREISKYGTKSVVDQISRVLSERLKTGQPSFVELLAPLIQDCRRVSPELAAQFVARGIYRQLVQRIWAVVRSGSTHVDYDVLSALYYGVVPAGM